MSLLSCFGNKKMCFFISNIQNKAPSLVSCFGNKKMCIFISNIQNKALRNKALKTLRFPS